MISEVQGDIFKVKDLDIIAHQANCFHTMGSGIAAQVREKYPAAYEADCQTGNGDKGKMGTLSMADIPRDDGTILTIVNIYGQYTFERDRRATSYDALYDGLSTLKGHMLRIEPYKHKKAWHLGVPKFMGCALGGGSWIVVNAMLYDLFATCAPVDLTICEFTPPCI